MSQQTEGATFEQLYLKERKKSNVFMAATAVAVILALGSFVYAMNKSAEPDQPFVSGEGGPTQQFGGPGGGGGGVRVGGPAMDVTEFLNDDGSVDTAAIDDMLENIPDDFRDRMLDRMEDQIDEAESDGDITAAQATELKAAFGITGDSNET